MLQMIAKNGSLPISLNWGGGSFSVLLAWDASIY